MRRVQSFSAILGGYLLLTLLTYSLCLLGWSYRVADRTLERELQVSFSQRHLIAASVFRRRLILLDAGLREVSRRPALARALGSGHQADLRDLLLAHLDSSVDQDLDVLFLVDETGTVAADVSSPLFGLEAGLTELAREIEDLLDDHQLIQLREGGKTHTLASRAIEVVDPESGRVLGAVVGGHVLDHDLSLLQEIRKETGAAQVVLLADGRWIGTTLSPEGDAARDLRGLSAEPTGQVVQRSGLLATLRPLNRHLTSFRLEVLLAVPDQPLLDLQGAFRGSMMVVVGVTLLYLVLSLFLLRRLLAPSIQELGDYASRVEASTRPSAEEAPLPSAFQPGVVVELNEVGRAMESMVGRFQSLTRELAEEVEERKQAQAQLEHHQLHLEELVEERSEELRRSNQELQQFAYVASHDLQEPLRMVTSYLQLFEREVGGDLSEKAREFLEYAVDGSQRMRQLIQDLLQLSRVGSQGKPFVPFPGEEMIQRVEASLALMAEDCGGSLSHDPFPEIQGDRMQLSQLFQNLLANGLKFHGENPPRVHVGVEERGEEWIFSVGDNGIGIEERFQERIFQVFQRLHTRESYEGTGIGLAICRKVVQRHQGRIWFESTPGEGSTFFVALPRFHEPETPPGPDQPSGGVSPAAG